MANLLDNCPTCFEITLNECADSIVIEGGFIVFEDYVIIITDKFGHEYRLNLTAGYDGELTIDVTDLPDGLFTAYSGVFTVKIYESDGCTPATITICEVVYGCIKLSFKTVYNQDAEEEITERIGCCEPIPPLGSIELTLSQECIEVLGLLTPALVCNLIVTGGSSTTYILQRIVGEDIQVVSQFNGLPTSGTFSTDPVGGIDLSEHIYRIVSGEIISNEINFTQTSCEPTSLVFNSLSALDAIANITFTNTFEFGSYGLDILFEGSFDNINWNGDTVQAGALPTNPYTGNHTLFSNCNMVFPYHRAVGKDGLGNLVYSNSIQQT